MIDDILSIVNKFIPDKTNQEQIKLELEKLELEKLKVKGNILDKLNKHERAIIPSFLLALLIMYVLTFMSDFIFSILGKEAPIIHIPNEYVGFCKLLVSLIFGKKTIQKFSKGSD